MKIGIDVDGVLLDSERAYRTSSEIFTLDELGANTDRLIHKTEMAVEDRLEWNDEESKLWHEKYLLKDAINSNFMPGAIEVVKKLQDMGHETYIITARGGDFEEMKSATLEKIMDSGLNFKEYYFSVEDKGKFCLENGIELLIDDSMKNCKRACDMGIKTLYFRDVSMEKLNHELSVEVNNWGEIYKYFKLYV